MKNIIFYLLVICSAVSSAFGGDINIQYVNSIEKGLSSPTSIVVSNNEIAVLEPFSRQIKVFSTSGYLQHKINLTGAAIGLVKIGEGLYAYCDRSSKNVVLVDITDGSQAAYLDQLSNINDPIDLVKTATMLYILDAGSKQIVTYDYSDGSTSLIALKDSLGQAMSFPSTFDINPITLSFIVFDQTTSEIWNFDSQGNFQNKFGSFGGGDDQVTRGGEMAVDNRGNIFINDRFQNRVVIYNSQGVHLTNIDATSTEAGGFNIPAGLDIDENGLLFVSSTEGSNIRIFHIEQATSENNYMANYLYPLLNDTVSINSLALSAVVEIFDVNEIVNGFDFQLFKIDTMHLIDEINQVKPFQTENTNNENLYYQAEWALDISLDNDETYIWRTRVSVNGIIGQWSEYQSFKTTSLPFTFELFQNYPNPFNPTTTIGFDIAVRSKVRLEIYNVLGQKVEVLIDRELEAGHYEENWNATDQSVASGLYFYKLVSGEFQKTRKMVLLK